MYTHIHMYISLGREFCSYSAESAVHIIDLFVFRDYSKTNRQGSDRVFKKKRHGLQKTRNGVTGTCKFGPFKFDCA